MYAVKTDVGLPTFPERVVINKIMDPSTELNRRREAFLNSPTVDMPYM